MFNGIKNFVKQAVFKMNVFFNGNDIGGNMSSTTNVMRTNIELWYDLYQGNAPWLQHNRQSLGLPAAISSEIARLVTLEMEININATKMSAGQSKDGDNLTSSKAEFVDKMLKPFRSNIRNYCEYACASGGVMFKPYFNGEGISIECVQAVDFQPITFDAKGVITACRFAEHKVVGKYIYHRVEEHNLENQRLTITNKCYRSSSTNERGTEVPLSQVPEWAEIEPQVTLENVPRPLYEYFRIPIGNNIDPSSALGVSVFGRSIDLIEDADMQYQRYNWEFEGGELAIDASKDIFPNDKNGNPIIPRGKERLFRPNEYDIAEGSGENAIKTFSPELREVSIKSGLNTILQRIEFNCGLAYGTLSDPNVVDKTAEEIKTSKQRSYSLVSDIQKALEHAINGLIEAICVTADLYSDKIQESIQGDFETAYVWDDSIIIDSDTERTRDMNEVRQGLMLKYEYRMKWRGEDEETAKRRVAEQEQASANANNPFGFSNTSKQE